MHNHLGIQLCGVIRLYLGLCLAREGCVCVELFVPCADYIVVITEDMFGGITVSQKDDTKDAHAVATGWVCYCWAEGDKEVGPGMAR